MQFQVPQFTERESKIVGPFTLKQFGWMALAGLLVVVVQFILSGTLLIAAIIIIVGGASAMAYAKVDNVSLPVYIGYACMYVLGNKKYIYEKHESFTRLP